MGKGTEEKKLKQQLKGLSHPVYKGVNSLQKLSIKKVPDSVVYNWHDCYFVAANEKSGTVETKLRTILRLLAAQRSSALGFTKRGEYNSIGYDYIEIKL